MQLIATVAEVLKRRDEAGDRPLVHLRASRRRRRGCSARASLLSFTRRRCVDDDGDAFVILRMRHAPYSHLLVMHALLYLIATLDARRNSATKRDIDEIS